MGVMACNRHECDSVMCHIYSETYGYICDECFNELVSIFTRDHISIEDFMNSPKPPRECEYQTWFFNSLSSPPSRGESITQSMLLSDTGGCNPGPRYYVRKLAPLFYTS